MRTFLLHAFRYYRAGGDFSGARKINPNNATGSDGISGRMLLPCDSTVALPQIIFRNILLTSIYINEVAMV